MHRSKTDRFLPEDEPGVTLLSLSLPQHAPIKDVVAEHKQKVTDVTIQVTKVVAILAALFKKVL